MPEPRIVTHIKTQLKRSAGDQDLQVDMIEAFERLLKIAVASETSDSIANIEQDLQISSDFLRFHLRVARADKANGLIPPLPDVRGLAGEFKPKKVLPASDTTTDPYEKFYGSGGMYGGGGRWTGD